MPIVNKIQLVPIQSSTNDMAYHYKNQTLWPIRQSSPRKLPFDRMSWTNWEHFEQLLSIMIHSRLACKYTLSKLAMFNMWP